MAKIKKTLKDKIDELLLGLDAIENANNSFRKSRNPSFLLTIQAQLRGLVGMHGNTMKPLLLNLSDELNIPLYVYTHPPLNALNSNFEITKMTFHVAIGKCWNSIERPGLCKKSLRDWLNESLYLTDTTYQMNSRNQIIKAASNFQGGTHYLDEVPHIVDTLKRIEISTTGNGLNDVLIDIAGVVYWAGKRLVLSYKLREVKQNTTLNEEEKKPQIKAFEEEIKKYDCYFEDIDAERPYLIIQAGE